MPSHPRRTKKPTDSNRRIPPEAQAPIPLHIERHIEPPSYAPRPTEPAPSRVIVIDLVDD